jgi:hypothetical protein
MHADLVRFRLKRRCALHDARRHKRAMLGSRFFRNSNARLRPSISFARRVNSAAASRKWPVNVYRVSAETLPESIIAVQPNS